MADEIAACYEGPAADDHRRAHRQRRADGRPDPHDRRADAGRRAAGVELSRGHDDARRAGDQFRTDARHRRPRRAAGRRHLRHRPHAQARDGQDARFRAGVACGRRCCCGRRPGRKSNTSPTSWRSTFRTSSWSATGSTTKTCTAICRIWPSLEESDIARHKEMTVETAQTASVPSARQERSRRLA